MKNPPVNPIARQSQAWLTEALLRLMERKPFAEITVTEITQKAGLSRRTFYRIFTTREEVLAHYADNRRLLLDGLRGIGIDRLAPTDGAFYVYADVSAFTSDSLSFCSKLLADTGVAIAPGIDFDTVRGSSFVRLSFAGPTSDVEEAVRRSGPWLG